MDMRVRRNRISLTDRSTLQDRVCETIRQSIFQGIFKPNEHLIQEELANQLGVSRMPVREALQQLEKEGLVVNAPHRGSVVAAITIEDIKEIYTMRLKLESLAALNSFPNLKDRHFKKLHRILDEMDGALDNNEKEYYSELNSQFHNVLLEENRWKRLKNMIENLWNGFTPYAPSITGKVQRSLQEHHNIMKLIEEGKFEEAVALYESHIANARDGLIHYIKETPSILSEGLHMEVSGEDD